MGNNPKSPSIALVGLCPGATQLNRFIESYKDGMNIPQAASQSGFRKLGKNLSMLLNAIDINKVIEENITPEYDFNNSPHFLVTSLVKCAFLGNETNPSQRFDPTRFEFAKRCITNRFVSDILNPAYNNLKIVIILGKDGWNAVNSIKIGDVTVATYMEYRGKTFIELPHPSGANNGRIKKFISDSDDTLRCIAKNKIKELYS